MSGVEARLARLEAAAPATPPVILFARPDGVVVDGAGRPVALPLAPGATVVRFEIVPSRPIPEGTA